MLLNRTRPRLRPSLLAWLFLLASLALLSPRANAQSQTDITTQTAWWYLTNATAQQVTDRVNLGYRLVDLEVNDDSPLRFAASFVRNTGDYAKGWWWYHGLSAAGVSTLLSQNNARLIDVEPYETPGGLRYAVVMIHNVGADYSSSQGWQTGYTQAQVVAWINANQSHRVLDIQTYTENGQRLYAFIWVRNAGAFQSAWWFLINGTATDVNNLISTNQARLIDLERETSGRFTGILTPRDGQAWYYYYGLTGEQLSTIPDQLACRIIDIERIDTASGARYDIILRRNDNDLAISTNIAMRSELPLGSSDARYESLSVFASGA